ncbi:MAG: class I SAM-dependent methyltransferase [Candidatus Diapherotrites archaeon]
MSVDDKKLKYWFDERINCHDTYYYEGYYGPHMWKYIRAKLRPYYSHFKSVSKNAKILDVGCATGHLLIGLSRFYFPDATLYGVDISKGMVKVASDKAKQISAKNVSFQVGVAEKLPFKDNEMDIVFCNAVIQHIPKERHKLVVKELFRTVKPGGYLCIEVPSSLGFSGKSTSVEIIKETDKRIIYEYQFSRSEFIDLFSILNKNDFKIVNFSGAEAWGLKKIMGVTRRLNEKYGLPKWMLWFITILQMKIVGASLFPSLWRGYKVIIRKK